MYTCQVKWIVLPHFATHCSTSIAAATSDGNLWTTFKVTAKILWLTLCGAVYMLTRLMDRQPSRIILFSFLAVAAMNCFPNYCCRWRKPKSEQLATRQFVEEHCARPCQTWSPEKLTSSTEIISSSSGTGSVSGSSICGSGYLLHYAEKFEHYVNCPNSYTS